MAKINIQLKSFDSLSLSLGSLFFHDLANLLDIHEIKEIAYPKKKKIVTVIRSPHIYKNSREQFQQIRHKKSILLTCLKEKDKDLISVIFHVCKDLQLPGVEVQISLKYNTGIINF